jgi:AcrR family transcriptional regulator
MTLRSRKPRKRRPVQQRSQDTVEIIVRATAHILSREGPAHLTTNRVAEKAGVSIGSLYQYFPNKQALVDEVRRRYGEMFRERLLTLAGTLGDLSLHDAVERTVRALVAIHAEDTGLHNAVSAAGLDDTERRLLHQVAASWLESRRDEVRRPNRALAAVVALDVAEALVHGVALRNPEQLADDAFTSEVTDLLVRYLAK